MKNNNLIRVEKYLLNHLGFGICFLLLWIFVLEFVFLLFVIFPSLRSLRFQKGTPKGVSRGVLRIFGPVDLRTLRFLKVCDLDFGIYFL